MVLRDEKMGISFCTIAYCPAWTLMMSGNVCMYCMYFSFGNLNELVALASGYKQLGITLAFHSNGIEFLTTTKNSTLSCMVNSRCKFIWRGNDKYACINQVDLTEIAVINVTFTFVLI